MLKHAALTERGKVMTIDEIRLKNLNTLIKVAKGKSRLTERAQLGRRYLWQVHSGRHFSKDPNLDRSKLRYMGSTVARRIEAAMNLHEGWLDLPHEELAGGEPVLTQRVPILSWVEITRYHEMQPDDLLRKDAMIYAGQNVGPLICMQVQGDSMVAEAGGEFTFPPGAFIFVSPRLAPKERDFVVAKLPGQDALLRQMMHDGSRPMLRALNPRYPMIHLSARGKILGVVTDMQVRMPNLAQREVLPA
jgi:SOS-response transcriptional repressor LexA